MPKLAKPLTDIQLRNARPGKTPYTLSDGEGLTLLVNPNGSKYWRLRYTFNKQKKTLALGVYPNVSLATAREARANAKKEIQGNKDPAQIRRVEKRQKELDAENTFETVARNWHASKLDSWQPRTAKNILHRLEKDVFPIIGKYPISEITKTNIIDMIKEIEKRGALEMARRQAQVCRQIFTWANDTEILKTNPSPSANASKSRVKGHHASITKEEFPAFIKAFKAIEGRMYITTRVMFRLLMITFVRTNELTGATWDEIDFENQEWIIPWQRMKMGRRKVNPRKLDHHVFLPWQGWELLRELHAVTGNNKYLFPNIRDHEKPATNYGVLASIKRMGYAGRMTGHGFRSLAMGTLQAKLGYRREVVKRQLAHGSDDEYGEAYDREQFLDERKVMMQQYADYIYGVESGNVVVGKFGKVA